MAFFVQPKLRFLYQRLEWLMFFRIILMTVVGLGLVILQVTVDAQFQKENLIDPPQAWMVFSSPIIWVVLGTYLLNTLYIYTLKKLKSHTYLEGFAYVQLFFDVGLSGCLIMMSGRLESPLFFLFALHVLSGALLLYREGGWFVVVLTIGFLILLCAYEVSLLDFKRLDDASGQLKDILVSGLTNSGVVCFVAALSAHLSEQVRTAQVRLRFVNQDLRSLQSLNDHLLTSVHHGLLQLNAHGQILFVNPAAESILGQTTEDLLTQPLSLICPQLPAFDTRPIFDEKISSDSIPSLPLIPSVDSSNLSISTLPPTPHHSQPSLPVSSSSVDPLHPTLLSLTPHDLATEYTWLTYHASNQSWYWEQPLLHAQNLKISCALSPMYQGHSLHYPINLSRHTSPPITGWILMIQDITRVRNLEEELQQKHHLSLIGEFAAQIAHEIRNPLASMSSSLQLLQDPLPLETQHRLLSILNRETTRLNELVDDFLHFARPPHPNPIRLEVLSLIQEVADLIQLSLEGNMKDTVYIEVDPDHFRQVIWNLFKNAQEANATKIKVESAYTHLQLKTSSSLEEGIEVDALYLSFIDNGDGLADLDIDTLFHPFITHKTQGSGLGLALCKSLIEAHQGHLTLSAHSLGCQVTIILPCKSTLLNSPDSVLEP